MRRFCSKPSWIFPLTVTIKNVPYLLKELKGTYAQAPRADRQTQSVLHRSPASWRTLIRSSSAHCRAAEGQKRDPLGPGGSSSEAIHQHHSLSQSHPTTPAQHASTYPIATSQGTCNAWGFPSDYSSIVLWLVHLISPLPPLPLTLVAANQPRAIP